MTCNDIEIFVVAIIMFSALYIGMYYLQEWSGGCEDWGGSSWAGGCKIVIDINGNKIYR